MTNYPEAKVKFLEWLQEQGERRGYTPEVDEGERVIFERPRLLARTRASVDQHRHLNFKVNEEVEYKNDEFERVYSIILDLHDSRTWDAEHDTFYPLSLTFLGNLAKRDINGDYPVTVDLSHGAVEGRKNRLQALFPIEEEGDWEPPAERIRNARTKELNDIAKNL